MLVNETNLWLGLFLRVILCMNLTNGFIVISKDNVGALDWETVSAKRKEAHLVTTDKSHIQSQRVSVRFIP